MIRKLLKTPVSLLIFTLLGIGIAVGMTPIVQLLKFPELPALLSALGLGFVFLLELALLPWLFTSVTLSFSSLVQNGLGPKHLGKSFLVSGSSVLIIAAVGIVSSLILIPGKGLQASSLNIMGTTMQNVDPIMLLSGDLSKFLPAGPFPGTLLIIPLLGVLILALIFGAAVGSTSEGSYENLTQMIRSLHEAFQKIISGLLYILPFGLFCLASSLYLALQGFPFSAFPLLFIILGGSVFVFLVSGFILVWLRSGKSFLATLVAFTEPVLTALLSSEVITALPSATLNLEKKLGFDSRKTGLNIPYGLIAVKYGQILVNVIMVSFILQVYGISLDVLSMIGLYGSSIIAALLSVGLGNLLAPTLLAVPLAYFGVPREAVFLLYTMAAFISPLSAIVTLMTNCATTALICNTPRAAAATSTADITPVRLRDDFDDEIVLQKDESPLPDYSVSDETWLPREEPISIQTLRIIVPQKEMRPFLFHTNDGRPDGIDIRLLREIAARLNRKIIIEQEDMTQSQMFERLRNGQSDIAAGRILEKGSMALGVVLSGPYASVQENGERIFTVLALAPGFEFSSKVNSIIKELTAKQFVNKALASFGGK